MSHEALEQKLATIQTLVAECLGIIATESGSKKKSAVPDRPTSNPPISTSSLNYELNIRAFIKKYRLGLNGPQKFTLMVAYVAKGDPTKKVLLDAVKQSWNNMKGKDLLGMPFNRAYTTWAKDNGWIDSPEKGVYVLGPLWTEMFSE